jgi:hypothetical protein
MSNPEERLWREGLERRGKDWTLRALNSRHGQAGDAVLDVVFVEPYPNREFCQRWCAEQENRMFSMSGHTTAIIVTLIVLAAVSTMAVSALENYRPPQEGYASVNPAPSGEVTAPTNSITDPVPSVTGNTSSVTTHPPGLCAYATYQTAACKSP